MSKAAYTTHEGDRWAYMVADSEDGTPFGFGNSEEDAITDAGSGKGFYWTEDDKWVAATPEWVRDKLADGTLEVLSAKDLNEDQKVL